MVGRRALLTGGIALCVAFSAGFAVPALAQSYPDKPVKMIVPFPAGGPIDTMARLTAADLGTRLSQQVIVENRPGAGSTIGFKAAASAEPDGYTLLFGSSGSLAIVDALYPSLDVNPLKHFTTVATTSLLPHIMVVGPSVPAKTVGELIAYARANPGKLNYGAGLGTPPHLLSTLFKTQAGLDVTYVPYKGSAPSVTDLLAGQTHFTIDGMLILIPQVKQGKLRPLAVARPERWPDLPDVPTFVESGFPDLIVDAWTGVVAPKGTPAPIIDKLNAAINEGLRTPETKTALSHFSALPKASSPAEFDAFLRDQLTKWAAMVKLAGAKGE
ncbi:Bug family tripartite tricarboxylate transporter substrate binding protein [Rhodoplanes sp. Z2-YC6860]|uniref:Bug family tripartite tricarboxylate transporter substrate binding protein n=1 Tax=Rhodoplanes sp. Z2-YC6860 TaxID=674703 RepID=UPI000AE00A2F|nr:tripartite tricarboxylate transporter substrate binding protein [Rhodoplanes sp. Z2-YC6860]